MNPIVEYVGDVVVVTVPGTQLDSSNVGEFKRQMTEVVEAHRQVVLDLGQLDFIDSAGCGAILMCLKLLTPRGGDLKLCSVTPPVHSVFDLIRLHKICDIYKTRDEAVAAFS